MTDVLKFDLLSIDYTILLNYKNKAASKFYFQYLLYETCKPIEECIATMLTYSIHKGDQLAEFLIDQMHYDNINPERSKCETIASYVKAMNVVFNRLNYIMPRESIIDAVASLGYYDATQLKL